MDFSGLANDIEKILKSLDEEIFSLDDSKLGLVRSGKADQKQGGTTLSALMKQNDQERDGGQASNSAEEQTKLTAEDLKNCECFQKFVVENAEQVEEILSTVVEEAAGGEILAESSLEETEVPIKEKSSYESQQIQSQSTPDGLEQSLTQKSPPTEVILKKVASLQFQNYAKYQEPVAFTQLPEEGYHLGVDSSNSITTLFEYTPPIGLFPSVNKTIDEHDQVSETLIPDTKPIELGYSETKIVSLQAPAEKDEVSKDLYACDCHDDSCIHENKVAGQHNQNVSTTRRPSFFAAVDESSKMHCSCDCHGNCSGARKDSLLASAVDSLILTAEKVEHSSDSYDIQSKADIENIAESAGNPNSKEIVEEILDLSVDRKMEDSPTHEVTEDDTMEISLCDCVVERNKINGEETKTVRIKLSQTQIAEVNEQESTQSEDLDLTRHIQLCECAQERMYGTDYLDKMPRIVGYIMNQQQEVNAKESNESESKESTTVQLLSTLATRSSASIIPVSKNDVVQSSATLPLESDEPTKRMQSDDEQPARLIRSNATRDLRVIEDGIPQKIDASNINELQVSNETITSESVEQSKVLEEEKPEEWTRAMTTDDLRIIEDEPQPNLNNSEMLSQSYESVLHQKVETLGSIESLHKTESVKLRRSQSQADLKCISSEDSAKSEKKLTKKPSRFNKCLLRLSNIFTTKKQPTQKH